MKGGIQGTGLDLEQVLRSPLDVFGDRVAVGGSGEQRSEDEEGEGALLEVHTGGLIAAHYVGILLYIM